MTSKPSLTNSPKLYFRGRAFCIVSVWLYDVFIEVVSVVFVLCQVDRFRKRFQAVIAPGFHLFPFRTEKLSPVAPMVLRCNVGE